MKVMFLYHSKQLEKQRLLRLAPLTHPLLAAYTPPDIQMSIVDESFETIDFDQHVDVVATTIIVPQAPRAYEVAEEFRKRGKTVVCGGPHATLMPNEAAEHFDSVLIGQGDMIWPQLLHDFKAGHLRQFYRNTHQIDMATIPVARRDLLNPKGYSILNTVQATRGCPFSCSYCTSRTIYPAFRAMPVRRVITEIEQLAGGPIHRKIFVFLDDNLMGNPVWAKRLFRELAPLKKLWMGQATFSITQDKELIKLAAQSGCKCLFIGLESFNHSSLEDCNKLHNNIELYKDGIKLLHDNGISIFAGIMFGFDHDTKDTFDMTLHNVIRLGIDVVGSNILAPYPNTDLFRRLTQENRILHTDWSKYDGKHAVFRPRHMTAQELESGRNWFHREFHSFRSIARRSWISKAVPWLTLPINVSKRRFRNECTFEARDTPHDNGFSTQVRPTGS